MPSDELPMYPTPQQAAYVVNGGGNSSRKSSRSNHPSYGDGGHHKSSHSSKAHTHEKYAQGHGASSGYSHSYQQGYQQPYSAPAPIVPSQVYYQPQPSPQAPMSHGYQQPAPSHTTYAQAPPAKQYYQPPAPQLPRPYQAAPGPAQGVHSPEVGQRPVHKVKVPEQFSAHSGAHSGPQKVPPPPMNPVSPPEALGTYPSYSRSKESLHDSTSTRTAKMSSKQKLENELRSVFDKVDKNGTGRISGTELSMALLNFDNTRFQDSTITLMTRIFSGSNAQSTGHSKSLNFDQFVSLWKYLSAYKKLFIQADTDDSGDISFGEFQKILEQIGYKLNVDLVLHLFQKFSYKGLGGDYDNGVSVGKLKFDAFIEMLVYLRKLTDVFKKYDKDLNGTATINFSDFLLEVSNLN